MHIPNGYKQNNPFVDQNYWLKSQNQQFNINQSQFDKTTK